MTKTAKIRQKSLLNARLRQFLSEYRKIDKTFEISVSNCIGKMRGVKLRDKNLKSGHPSQHQQAALTMGDSN